MNFSIIRVAKELYNNYLILGFCGLLLLSIFRSGNPDLTLVSKLSRATYLLLFIYVVFLLTSYIKGKKEILKVFHYGLLVPIFLYCTTNLFLWLINFKPKTFEVVEIGESLVLSKLTGIFIERVNFPLVSGTVSFGFLIGLLFLTAYFLFLESKNIIYLGVVFFSVILLLLNDSRAVIMSIVFILLFYRFRIFKTIAKFLPILVVIGPLFLLGLTFLLQYFEVTDFISRSNSDLETGNSRFIIWLITLDEMTSFKLQHLIGYGLYGTYSSGASQSWAQFFTKFENPLLTTAHNNIFSIFYDLGYIGVMVLLFSINTGIKNSLKISKPNLKNNFGMLLICLIVFFCIAGITDVTIGLYTALNGYYFIFIIIISNRLENISFTTENFKSEDV